MSDLFWWIAPAFCDPPALLDPWAAAPYLAAAFGLSYLIGGIPFALVITRAFGLGDIRKIGSGNIGATNVLRTGNKTAAALTLLADALKGLLPTLIAGWAAGPLMAAVAGFGAFLGHCYSPYLRFKGGKGVATGFGVLLAWSPVVGLLCAGVWLVALAMTRISSAASLSAAVAAPLWLNIYAECDALPLGLAMSALLFWKHRANIGRLIAGDEPRIGARKADPAAAPDAEREG